MHLAAALSMIEGKAGTADKKALASLLNEMILHRFELLVALLYRVDVPEEAVKQMLRQQPQADAGMLLAELLLQRQEQKEKARQNPSSDAGTILEKDRW